MKGLKYPFSYLPKLNFYIYINSICEFYLISLMYYNSKLNWNIIKYSIKKEHHYEISFILEIWEWFHINCSTNIVH